MDKAVVLFSAGIDSTTALYWALKRTQEVFALTVDYGQRHKIEVSMARKQARRLRVRHKVVRLDLRSFGGSSLTDESRPLPEYRAGGEIGSGVPDTYVPFRNGILLSMAAAWADVLEADSIICGFNIIDSPHYPDTRPAFVRAMEKAVNCGTRSSVNRKKIAIRAPFASMTKADIIRTGLSLGADYSLSVSCYAGGETPCWKCSSCILRRKAWQEVGLRDPLVERLAKEGNHELDTEGQG